MYAVLVADNYHYMDPESEYEVGRYETWKDAVERCKQIVDDSLKHLQKPGMSPEQLWNQYAMFGEDPFIVPGDERFSAWEYAREQCAKMSGSPS